MNEGYVYFILDRELDRVKIGYTRKDPNKRLKQLQTGSSSKLELLYYVEANGFNTERHLHRLFDADRCCGEFFNYSYHIKHWIMNNKYLKENKINNG